MTLRNPETKPHKFAECGCCGEYHDIDLPGEIDCRDEQHRFTIDRIEREVGRENVDWIEVYQ